MSGKAHAAPFGHGESLPTRVSGLHRRTTSSSHAQGAERFQQLDNESHQTTFHEKSGRRGRAAFVVRDARRNTLPPSPLGHPLPFLSVRPVVGSAEKTAQPPPREVARLPEAAAAPARSRRRCGSRRSRSRFARLAARSLPSRAQKAGISTARSSAYPPRSRS